MKSNLGISIVLLLFCGFGCQSAPRDSQPASQSNLTPGMAKRTMVKGQTTQAEVLEVFGPPDLVTHRDGLEIWTYDKTRYDVQSSGGYFTILIAGAASQRVTSSSVSTMLIVYFDENDVMRDYRLNTVKF